MNPKTPIDNIKRHTNIQNKYFESVQFEATIIETDGLTTDEKHVVDEIVNLYALAYAYDNHDYLQIADDKMNEFRRYLDNKTQLKEMRKQVMAF